MTSDTPPKSPTSNPELKPESISTDEIKKVAALARLELSSDEIHQFPIQIEKALEFFSQINSIVTDNVKPLVSPFQEAPVFRADIARSESEMTADHSDVEKHLERAPDRQGRLFRVPPVV
ncbi:MAG TPA: Asp-tRNA(Asn)/Glu-tRNA(Gln) amidotransferase subunit GatC [Pseudobdellovibrionaceae bacterium]|nr:Asp-tRNA(Asn)/Glu-tRNA(Gln) amidotransferase subunit GatC [Pseudobdellovibrionaceae bacterium]